MKRFLVSLSSLFVSTSFAIGLVKEQQTQTNELAASEKRFDDIFLKNEEQPFKSIDEVVSMFNSNNYDKTWHFLKSQTNLEKVFEPIQIMEPNLLLPSTFIELNQVQPFSNFYVLGDSLSDIGGLYNFTSELVKMPYPFYNNSFTDGNVAVKVLANKLSLPQKTAWPKHSLIAKALFDSDDIDYDINKFICNVFCKHDHCNGNCNEVCASICNKMFHSITKPYRNNYAVGGARASLGTDDKAKLLYNYFSLEKQVDLLLTDHKIKPTDLIYLGIGGNDILAAVKEKSYFEAMEIIVQSLLAIENSVNRLIKNNARHIILANAPNVAKTPRYLTSLHRDYAWQISNKYYDMFESMYAKLEEKYPTCLKKFNLHNCFNKMLCDFEEKGINITSPCVDVQYSGIETLILGFNPNFTTGCDATSLSKYFFFDDIHPTAIVHKEVGEQLYQLALSKW